jgi:hypothetical protein
MVIIAAICQCPSGMAQTSATEPARAAGYDRLNPIVGRWYDGNFHIVCETERKRKDGSIGRSMSILSYLPDKDRYTCPDGAFLGQRSAIYRRDFG